MRKLNSIKTILYKFKDKTNLLLLFMRLKKDFDFGLTKANDLLNRIL